LLKVAAVAGGANNQLAQADRDGPALAKRGITLAPDYVINAGGVIQACGEYFKWDKQQVKSRIEGIGSRLAVIFAEARADSVPTDVVADRMAERLFHRPPISSQSAGSLLEDSTQ
jgi:leucine dehydrogenase